MPALINSYVACHLFNVDHTDGPEGPFVIAQEAYDPEDLLTGDTIFLLRRDGTWIDEIAQSKLPEDRRFLVFFDSPTEAAEALENLRGIPVIERLEITDSDLRARIADLKAGGFTSRGSALVEHYRAWKRSLQP